MMKPEPQARAEEVLNLSPDSSFRGLAFEDVEVHLRIRRYGDFVLTEAVSPSYDIQVRPEEGYRREEYRDPDSGEVIPFRIAAVSAPRIMGLIHGVMQRLADEGCETVSATLISSRPTGESSGQYWRRDAIDIPVLASILEEYKDLLLNDGYTGIAISAESLAIEVTLNEHKLFEFYGNPRLSQSILAQYGLALKPEMQFLPEAEHLHNSRAEFDEQLERLRLAIAD